MSLIEEALRKQGGEGGRQRASPAASAKASSSPPHAAPASASPSYAAPASASQPHVARARVSSRSAPHRGGLLPNLRRQRKLMTMVLFGFGVLLTLLGAGTLLLYLSRRLQPEMNVSPAPVYDHGLLPKPAVVELALPAATTVVAAVVAPVAEPLPVVPADAMSVVTAATSLVATAMPMGAASMAVVTTTAPSASVAASVTWPVIKINGTFSSGGNAVVLLGDGLMLETGAMTPSGVQLLDVVSGAVRLAYKGQIRTYRRSGGAFVAEISE